MLINVYDFIKKSEYEEFCKSLKKGEIKTIYTDKNIDIEIKKVNNKIFLFINSYGDKKIDEVINNVCSLI